MFFFFLFCFVSILILYFRYHDVHTMMADNDRGPRELAIRVKQAQEPAVFFFSLTVKKILPIFGYLKMAWSTPGRFSAQGAGQLGPGWVVATPSVMGAWPIVTEIAVTVIYRCESPHLKRTHPKNQTEPNFGIPNQDSCNYAICLVLESPVIRTN